MSSTERIYIGFWLRLWASVVDSVVILLITLPILFAIYGRDYLVLSNDQLGWGYELITWIFPALAIIVCWYWRSATPGKIVISAQIVDAKTGNKPSFWQSLIRYIGYFISLIPFGFGFLWIAWDDKKQGWHDKIAGTVVIQTTTAPKLVRKKLWISVLIIAIIVSLSIFLGGDLISKAFISDTDTSLKRYSDAGFTFGQGMPSNLCWEEALWRIDHRCHDLHCKYGQVYFLKACLVASNVQPASQFGG